MAVLGAILPFILALEYCFVSNEKWISVFLNIFRKKNVTVYFVNITIPKPQLHHNFSGAAMDEECAFTLGRYTFGWWRFHFFRSRNRDFLLRYRFLWDFRHLKTFILRH